MGSKCARHQRLKLDGLVRKFVGLSALAIGAQGLAPLWKQHGILQKRTKKALGFLKVISDGLEPATKQALACQNLLPAIAAWFGLV